MMARNSVVPLDQQIGNTPAENAARLDLRRSLRQPAIACAIVFVGFFGLFGGWMAVAPLSSAAVAQGVVSPEGSRKTVQHLEGGIIKQFLVREGALVKKGDLLIVLDDTQARANYTGLQSQALRFTATKLRIAALQRRATELNLAASFTDAITDKDFAQFVANEQEIFETRRRTLEQQRQIYAQQIEQLKEEIRGYQAQIESTAIQLKFIDEELADTRQLMNQGLARKPRVMELERMRANLVGNSGQLVSSVAKSQQKIAEIALNQLDLENKFFNEQNDLLLKTNTDLSQVEEKISAARDVLARTEIRAPITGIIVNLRFKTTEGVIKPGEPILDIVPTEDDLVIEARVSPNDIDAVKPGQTAQVHLTPYHTRYTNLLHGNLRDISADTYTDDKTNTRYYKANIVVDREDVKKVDENIVLSAGMPAEVFIRTGEHTLLTYMIEPFSRSLRRSFREK
jgi:HlyD family secretion protein/epimerase transport system membrane fusion protein